MDYAAASLGKRFPAFRGNVDKGPLDGNLRHTAAKIFKTRTAWFCFQVVRISKLFGHTSKGKVLPITGHEGPEGE